jgi:hypothetical protein
MTSVVCASHLQYGWKIFSQDVIAKEGRKENPLKHPVYKSTGQIKYQPNDAGKRSN